MLGIMKKRTLGNTGLEVSAIGFGCMGLDGELRSPGRPAIEAIALLHAAV